MSDQPQPVLPQPPKRSPFKQWALSVVTPAAVGAVVGFGATQLAALVSDHRKENAELRSEELKEARTLVRELADGLAKAKLTKVEDAANHIESLNRKRRSFTTDDAKAMLTREIIDLESEKSALQARDSETQRATAQAAAAEAAKRRGDAEAARKAEEQSRLNSEAAAKAAREIDVLGRIREDRMRRLGVY